MTPESEGEALQRSGMRAGFALPAWSYACGASPVRARLRCSPEDFRVDEDLGFPPDGEGQHVLVQVRKRGANTEWVARQLARHAGVASADVGFAGLKDRDAVTTQWFSVDLAGCPEPEWSTLDAEGVEVLGRACHRRKLRRGMLQGNHFDLVLRELSGPREELEARLRQVAKRGVPNYFGEQRFGRDGGNLIAAEALLSGGRRERNRHKRGLYLSAARSYLFNTVLSHRVARGDWRRALPGEVLMPADVGSLVVTDAVDEKIALQVKRGELRPTGPLWGRGRPLPRGEALALEEAALEKLAAWCRGLEFVGLKQDRRPLALPVCQLDWNFVDARTLRLRFKLPPGGYATTVLRELIVAK